MKDDQKLYLECDCLSEGIIVEKDSELGFIDLGFFGKGFQAKDFSWKNRFRLIWQIIRHGHPYVDMVTISKAKAKVLAEFLLKD